MSVLFFKQIEEEWKHDEEMMRHALDEYDAKIERTVLFHGKETFVNHIRIDTIYKRVNETKYGYGMEKDYYKVVVVFSKIKDNPEGYVVFEIKKENELLAFKESCDAPAHVLTNGRGFLRHGVTPQRTFTSPLHPVTGLPLSRLLGGFLF